MLAAGRKARAAIADEAAFSFLNSGLELLEPEVWQQEYALALALHTEAAEAAYLNGDVAVMERLVETVVQQARHVLDTVRIHEVRHQAYATQARFSAALQSGLELLQRLGVTLPASPEQWQVQEGFDAMYALLRSQPLDVLATLPVMTDPRAIASLRVLSSLYATAVLARPALAPLLLCAMLQVSVQYGCDAASPFVYACLGAVLRGQKQDYATGASLGQLALRTLERPDTVAFRCRTLTVVHDAIRYWTQNPSVPRSVACTRPSALA